MKWILIVPALSLCGCSQLNEDTYTRQYVVVCSGIRNGFFTEINTNRLNDRVNDYISHGYVVTGNLAGTRSEVCQTLEKGEADCSR